MVKSRYRSTYTHTHPQRGLPTTSPHTLTLYAATTYDRLTQMFSPVLTSICIQCRIQFALFRFPYDPLPSSPLQPSPARCRISPLSAAARAPGPRMSCTSCAPGPRERAAGTRPSPRGPARWGSANELQPAGDPLSMRGPAREARTSCTSCSPLAICSADITSPRCAANELHELHELPARDPHIWAFSSCSPRGLADPACQPAAKH